jgi:hypothetical protein
MNTQEKILHPSSRYWKQEIGAIILLLIILIAGILYFGVKMYVVGGFALLIGIPYLISEFRNLLRQQITFSKSEIIARIGKGDYRQSWESIRAVRLTGQGQSMLLVLYCDEHSLTIPCRFYDKVKLIENLKEHLSSIILHPQAYQRLPWFLEWKVNVERNILTMNRSLKVSLGGFEKWLGIFSLSLGLIFAGSAYFSKFEAIDFIILGGMFGGLGLLLLLLCIGWMEADVNQISIRSLFRRNTFIWNDLREIYINSNLGLMALVGDYSRLILPKVTSWSGKDKAMLDDFINYKIELSKIEPVESYKLVYWLSKTA